MIVARFPDAATLQGAAHRLRAAGLAVETRTPIALPEDEHARSLIPPLVLVAGLAAAIGGFALQWYGMVWGYKLLIGGRPSFFPTSFAIYAFECGVLAATTASFLGFLLANRLPRYWEKADESEHLREATRDGWFLVVDGKHAWERASELKPLSLEQVPA